MQEMFLINFAAIAINHIVPSASITLVADDELSISLILANDPRALILVIQISRDLLVFGSFSNLVCYYTKYTKIPLCDFLNFCRENAEKAKIVYKI